MKLVEFVYRYNVNNALYVHIFIYRSYAHVRIVYGVMGVSLPGTIFIKNCQVCSVWSHYFTVLYCMVSLQ